MATSQGHTGEARAPIISCIGVVEEYEEEIQSVNSNCPNLNFTIESAYLMSSIVSNDQLNQLM